MALVPLRRLIKESEVIVICVPITQKTEKRSFGPIRMTFFFINMRKIPVTMATQHPDNALPAYFNHNRYISTQDEIEECHLCFSDLGVEEYMWDWEGKFVDEAVIDRLFAKYYEFFKTKQLGKDIFLTFRLPNIWLESNHKLPRAFMNMISAAEAAGKYGFHTPPLFEVILPMTNSASQLIYLHKTFAKIAEASAKIFDMKPLLKRIDVIPLFEDFSVLLHSKDILHEYANFLNKKYKFKPEYLRVFTARSDTAMNAGFLPAKLAALAAISNYHQFEKESGIEVYPWIGAGALQFRGGINPEDTEKVLADNQGISSLTVQSSFRYDYPLELVKKSIVTFNNQIPLIKQKYKITDDDDLQAIEHFNDQAAKYYRSVIEHVADIINTIANKLPSHRERVLHIGMLGYGRGVGKVKLPRAIKFTGALYSLGVPPELIGTGRALKYARKLGYLKLIERLCPYLKWSLSKAGRYLNRENLNLLSKQNVMWNDVKKDIKETEKYTGEEIGPREAGDFLHRNYTSNIYRKFAANIDISEDILKAAEIRKSLG